MQFSPVYNGELVLKVYAVILPAVFTRIRWWTSAHVVIFSTTSSTTNHCTLTTVGTWTAGTYAIICHCREENYLESIRYTFIAVICNYKIQKPCEYFNAFVTLLQLIERWLAYTVMTQQITVTQCSYDYVIGNAHANRTQQRHDENATQQRPV